MSTPHKSSPSFVSAGVVVALLLFAVPAGVYLATFGPTLSNEHSRWAEFGAAMAGIYAPVVALLALAIWRQQVLLQQQIAAQQWEQAQLQQARGDVEFFATRLAAEIQAHLLPDQTVRQVLHKNFQPRQSQELDLPDLRGLATYIDTTSPNTLALWVAIYPILTELAGGDSPMARMVRTSALQKVIALLGFDTCVALDNFHRTRTEGLIELQYCFSPLLSAPRSS